MNWALSIISIQSVFQRSFWGCDSSKIFASWEQQAEDPTKQNGFHLHAESHPVQQPMELHLQSSQP